MANIKSSKKRILTSERQRTENKYVKSTLSTLIKSFRKLIIEGNLVLAESKLIDTISYIDSACSKGVIHKNNASRKVGRMSATLYKAKLAKKEEVAENKDVEQVVNEPVKEEKKSTKNVVKKPALKDAKKVAKSDNKVEELAEKKVEVEKAPAKKAVAKKADTKKAVKKPVAKKAVKK